MTYENRDPGDETSYEGAPPGVESPCSADTMVGWLREAADEIENAHRTLDRRGIARYGFLREGVEATLALRIAFALDERAS